MSSADTAANTSSPRSSHRPTWQMLYQAALFERDGSRVTERAEEAEREILSRVRELLSESGDHIEEESVLDDALYALRALRNSLGQEQAA